MRVSAIPPMQAWVPWNHVYRVPQSLRQLPPGAQQLSLPLLYLPHTGQPGPGRIYKRILSQEWMERQATC